MMPVKGGVNVFRRIVRTFERICFLELLDSVIDATNPSQIVCPHMGGMRNRRGDSRKHFAMLEGLVDASDCFVGVDKIMVGRGVIGYEGKHAIVKRRR